MISRVRIGTESLTIAVPPAFVAEQLKAVH